MVNAYQSRLDGSHAAANLLSDSAEDTLESTVDSSVNFLTQDDGGANPDQTYAALFGMDTPPAVTVASAGAPVPSRPSGVPTASNADSISFPEVPSAVPGSASGGHRRAPSFSGALDDDGGIGWMLAAPETSSKN